MSDINLAEIIDFTVALARKAGALILEGSAAIQSQPASAVNEKKNSVDLVTEYDVRVEELVKKEISSKYPNFQLCVVSPALLYSNTSIRFFLALARKATQQAPALP